MRGATGLCPLPIATDPRCVAGAGALRHHSPQYKIFARDSVERKRDKPMSPGENWLRGRDLNSRPSGYEPDELPGCSTPRPNYADLTRRIKFKKAIADLRARSKVALAAGGGLRKIHAAQSGGKQNPA